MSLVRSFTSRRNKPAAEALGNRNAKPINRSQISSPLALISTSNVLLNNAQHIAGTTEIQFRPESPSSPNSANSGDDSDITMNSFRTAASATDASSVDESPMENHLSCYFKPAVDTHAQSTIRQVSSSSMSISSDAPLLPQRQPSHSKRAHESLHRQRSVSRVISPPPSTLREVARASDEMSVNSRNQYVEAPKDSPFGHELAQLDEVAEEFGHAVRDAEASQDAVIMHSHGLAHFTASDYLSEIQELLSDTFYSQPSTNVQWI